MREYLNLRKKIIFLFLFVLIAINMTFGEEFFWENPKIIAPDNAWFPVTASGGGKGFILWQEYSSTGRNTDTVSFSVITTHDGVTLNQYKRVLGPFPVIGDKIPMVSIAVDKEGILYAAVALSGTGIALYRSTDDGKSFSLAGTAAGGNQIPTVGPKLYITSSGVFILFVTQPLSDNAPTGNQRALGITYAVSPNAVEWSSFKPLVTSSTLANIYLPFVVSTEGTEYVVFQASPEESRFYQLYYTASNNEGVSWSPPRRITTADEGGQSSNNFDNQRPFLTVHEGSIFITWERKLGMGKVIPYFGKLDIQQKTITGMKPIEGPGINSNPANNPQVVFIANTPVVLWYNTLGNIVMVQKPGNVWNNIDISGQFGTDINSFGRFLILSTGLNVIWQSSVHGTNRLVMLSPDKTVPKLILFAKNFKKNRPNKQSLYKITWNLPEDSSGIAGFSYAVDRVPDGTAPERVIITRRDPREAGVHIDEDGRWYFHVRAKDYAGNWSVPATLSFIRDTTPPGAVTIVPPAVDDKGFMVSNTGEIDWKPPKGEKVVRYSYRVQYLASGNFSGDITIFKILDTPNIPQTSETGYRFHNKDNGLWALSVSAFDAVGNKSKSNTYYFRLNKYIPVTFITKINAVQDILGAIKINIYGRGFLVGGKITAIILDKDREKPYDYIYTPQTNSYEVKTDRIISGLSINDMEQGSYYVGLIHPTRGLYFSRTTLTFESTGAVKFGNFSILNRDNGAGRILEKLFTLSMNSVVLLIIMLFLTVMFTAAAFKIVALAREGNHLTREAHALVYNEMLPSEKKKERMLTMKKRGMGLRIKFALLVTFLVLIIILMVAYPLSVFMIGTQQRNLTDSLEQTTKVLISSIKTSAAKYLQENNTLELKRLPAQISSMPAARFLTITGPGIQKTSDHFNDYIWVTNDENIRNKIDPENLKKFSKDSESFMPGGEKFVEGTLYMHDTLSAGLKKLSREIDKKGNETVGKLTIELAKLQVTAAKATKTARTKADIEEIRKMQDEILLISDSIKEKLGEISNRFSSVPIFDSAKILIEPTDYTFYTPIVFQPRGNNDSYYRGTVRLGISTKQIIHEIKLSRNVLLKRILIIAFIAIVLGIIGALILATIIIIPINQLLVKVKEISSTDDHLKLKSFSVQVKTKDEIYDLADAVNQMAHGLYDAAVVKADLTIGREIQKKFLPLDTDAKGHKLSTSYKSTETADFFGYYEGADEVSGDYFDYLEYEKDKYAIIKCDISGHGVPASLIMVEVATIFRSFFNDWKLNQLKRKQRAASVHKQYTFSEPRIDNLVYSINGLVEERAFTGRFAALIVVLADTSTGKTTFCHAGDNIIHLYKKAKQDVEVLTLPMAPACGVMPNDFIMTGPGYKNFPYQLEKGDFLFLFTDGIDESMRIVRDAEFNGIPVKKDNVDDSSKADAKNVDYQTEEMGIERIQKLIRAFFMKKQFVLAKEKNPVEDERLEFDFSSCSGTADEAVLAIMAVEKIFRIYPDPGATETDKISVDVKINEFLKSHFIQYKEYFGKPFGEDEGYILYTRLKEDIQRDDLTCLVLNRK